MRAGGRWTGGDLAVLSLGEDGPIAVTGRVVVLVDDGLITGLRAGAALRWLAGRGPRHLILATPACSAAARQAVSGAADAVLCLRNLPHLADLAECYADRRPPDEATVTGLLGANALATPG